MTKTRRKIGTAPVSKVAWARLRHQRRCLGREDGAKAGRAMPIRCTGVKSRMRLFRCTTRLNTIHSTTLGGEAASSMRSIPLVWALYPLR